MAARSLAAANGAVRNSARTWRHLAKAVSTADTATTEVVAVAADVVDEEASTAVPVVVETDPYTRTCLLPSRFRRSSNPGMRGTVS